MEKILEMEEANTIKDLCDGFNIDQASYFRWKKKRLTSSETDAPKKHWRALSNEEEKKVMEVLTSERFVDMSPEAVCATLLDEGKYYCSARTMYRILEKNKAVKERRNQRKHPEYTKPELLATGPNQLWSWDITKLRTDSKWTYHYLYVIIDVYSRYVVGWMVAPKENALLAEQFIAETCYKEGIVRDQLTIHADRGSAMKSKTVSQLMADLGVTKTHSRPHVSNDNPFSESQFKTLKYHSTYPKKFGSLEDAKLFLRSWFDWYNNEHRHSGIEMLCPADVHRGRADDILSKRQEILDGVYQRLPERFPKGPPLVKKLSKAVWINPPKEIAA